MCVKYCHNPEHQRLPSCYNCAIDGDSSKLDGHWPHCILYNCDACNFRDNLAEICEKLRENPENINNIYYTINKLFTLQQCTWGLGQPDKKNIINNMII